MPNLELYYMPSCPFCKKVLRVIDKLELNIPLKDVSTDKEAENKLLEVGGEDQVPCLFIDGKAMYESMDIINYLMDNFKK